MTGWELGLGVSGCEAISGGSQHGAVNGKDGVTFLDVGGEANAAGAAVVSEPVCPGAHQIVDYRNAGRDDAGCGQGSFPGLRVSLISVLGRYLGR